jgi:hypothetical protein
MKYLICFVLITMFFINSCGTIISTGDRFREENSKHATAPEINKRDTLSLTEDYDITPFKAKIIINDSLANKDIKGDNKLNAWYDYDTNKSTEGLRKLIRQTAGYRVLVLTTDNLEEANSMKSEIYFKTDQKPVYISFEPPFYKIKAGDFLNSSDASEFGFKLNQMGYTESRIIRDTVNILH